ncbi:GNAT family N-acetyltransferase [Chryseomicrobium sp. FSL W7-1435]|uniref:GNAT family N-acetyltransferase n=1 Tax=Chryseomicrobium sp. FSL W7-1435 TaxID=2921704 RepID=UPI00315AE724
MSTYIRLDASQLEMAAEWLARVNSQTTSHCGYCGSSKEEILESLREDFVEGESTSLVAELEGETIIGMIGFDYEEEFAEVWGPFSLSSNTEETLAFWNFATNEFPQLKSYSFFLHKDNSTQQKFMNTLQAELRGKHLYYRIQQPAKAESHKLTLETYSNQDNQKFIELHDTEFPDTYYDAKTILERSLLQGHTLYFAYFEKEFVGYSFFEEGIDSIHLEYFALDSFYRGQGFGEELLRVSLYQVTSASNLNTVTLTVDLLNDAANPLYEKVGFEIENELWNYRFETK